MQSFLVRAAMVGCLRAQARRARRLVEQPITPKAEAVGRSGDEDESAREGEGDLRIDVLTTRRTQLADSYDS